MTDATIDPNVSVLRPGVSDAEIEATAAKAALRRKELVIALRLGKPPAGYGHWTLQLLADELVALEMVDSISHETVRKVLKKMV